MSDTLSNRVHGAAMSALGQNRTSVRRSIDVRFTPERGHASGPG
jgi:hypothetical protein